MTLFGFHVLHKWSKWNRCLVQVNSPLLDMFGVNSTSKEIGLCRRCLECNLEDLTTID